MNHHFPLLLQSVIAVPCHHHCLPIHVPPLFVDCCVAPTSEVEPKMIFMGHEISSFHAPVVSSLFILFKTSVSSLSICYVHLVKFELITFYSPKISPAFSNRRLALSQFRIVLSKNCHVLSQFQLVHTIQLNLLKNHHVLSKNFPYFCRIVYSYCPIFDLYCPKIVLCCSNFNLYIPNIQLILFKNSLCTVQKFHLILSSRGLVLS